MVYEGGEGKRSERSDVFIGDEVTEEMLAGWLDDVPHEGVVRA